MNKIVTGLLSLLLPYQANAFSCYITMVKDTCWTKYNVQVSVKNQKLDKVMTTLDMPQGKSWDRQQFSCDLNEVLLLSATFAPHFWKEDPNTAYPAINEWVLPSTMDPGKSAWTLTLCYPSDFAEVPLPPDADNHCKCVTDSIPPVKL